MSHIVSITRVRPANDQTPYYTIKLFCSCGWYRVNSQWRRSGSPLDHGQLTFYGARAKEHLYRIHGITNFDMTLDNRSGDLIEPIGYVKEKI